MQHMFQVSNTNLITQTFYHIGNMWAQNWRNLADLVMPFPAKPPVDVSSEMLRQGYTPLR
jgi:hypothetical protein